MASVYKSISKKEKKKKERPVAAEDGDVTMDDVMENGIDDTSDSEEEEEQEEQEETQEQSGSGSGQQQQQTQTQNKSGLMPKTRVLMLTSRGVTYR